MTRRERKDPGPTYAVLTQLAAEIQRGWLLLFQDRTAAGQAHFEALFDRHPADLGSDKAVASGHQQFSTHSSNGKSERIVRGLWGLARPSGRSDVVVSIMYRRERRRIRNEVTCVVKI